MQPVLPVPTQIPHQVRSARPGPACGGAIPRPAGGTAGPSRDPSPLARRVRSEGGPLFRGPRRVGMTFVRHITEVAIRRGNLGNEGPVDPTPFLRSFPFLSLFAPSPAPRPPARGGPGGDGALLPRPSPAGPGPPAIAPRWLGSRARGAGRAAWRPLELINS